MPVTVPLPAALSVAIAAYLLARLNFIGAESRIPLRDLAWIDLLLHFGAILLIFACLVSLMKQWLQ